MGLKCSRVDRWSEEVDLPNTVSFLPNTVSFSFLEI